MNSRDPQKLVLSFPWLPKTDFYTFLSIAKSCVTKYVGSWDLGGWDCCFKSDPSVLSPQRHMFLGQLMNLDLKSEATFWWECRMVRLSVVKFDSNIKDVSAS
jgi:hypothetical protein